MTYIEPTGEFQTARQKIIAKHAQGGEEVELRTTPYHDVAQFVAEVVNANTTTGIAYAVFLPQELQFFTKGLGGQVTLGGVTAQNLPCDTNQAKAKSTNGATDMAIEGISCACIGSRCRYAATTGFGEGSVPTDPSVLAAVLGSLPVVDPFGILQPRQLQSPAMLQNAIFQGLAKQSTVVISPDTSRIFNLGLLDLIPSGAATSYLEANGEPTNENVMRFVEGIYWSKDGEADAEVDVKIKLERAVVVPIDLIMLPGSSAYTAPSHVYLPTRFRLHGLSIGPRGRN